MRIKFDALAGTIEEDPRPNGSVLFADSGTSTFTRAVHTFDEPHSRDGVERQHGINTPNSGRWGSHIGDTGWREMNQKRGVKEAENE